MQAVNFIRIKLILLFGPLWTITWSTQCLHRLSVCSVDLYHQRQQRAYLLPAAPYYRKYFKMRFESFEKDKVDIEAV